jgi:ADP-heptose:LPS heptosyltransferase
MVRAAPLDQACCRQPLSTPVPADDAGFAQRKSPFQRAVRTLRRRWQLHLSGQQRLRQERFAPRWHRLLWIHEGMPQLGDALMDLSARSLLAEAGMALDLWLPPHLLPLFGGDPWVQRVFALGAAGPAASDYDAVILLSDDRRSLVHKRRHLPELPWLSLHGEYNGPDFHRGLFAAQRIADWLEQPLGAAELSRHGHQKLPLTPEALSWARAQGDTTDAVLLALGGADGERSYHHWAELMHLLGLQGVRRWIWLGSDNARAMSQALRATLPAGAEVVDAVARTSLPQAQALIASAACAICCDGGLMHLALCTDTPLVALFNRRIAPAWRLPPGASPVRSLQADHDSVDAIAPARVAEAALALLGTRGVPRG